MSIHNSILTLSLMLATTVYGQQKSTDLHTPLPEQWNYSTEFTQNSPIDDEWWQHFCDPTLDSLIEMGVKNNYNVASAMRRIESARAQITQARAAYYPTVDVSAGWQYGRSSGMNGSVNEPATTSSYMTVSANMNWEIDIFGKVRREVNQKKDAWRASRVEYDAVMVSMAAEIASNYIQLRVAQTQLMVAREHCESQKRIVAIAEARHETGLASALDVAQAKAVYMATVASIPPLKNTIHVTINTLATLTGIYADDLPRGVFEPRQLHKMEALVAVGVPADLLRRRPDIMQAELQLAQAAAAVGIAKSDFLPTLSINATVGTSAHRAEDLFKDSSFGYTIAPTLSWNIFSGFSRKAAVADARATMESAIEDYNLIVMSAVTETGNAMDNYRLACETIRSTRDVVEQSTRALTLSTELYKSGNASFTDVANAQLSLLSYTNQLVTARGRALTALVTLYKALGGGWPGMNEAITNK